MKKVILYIRVSTDEQADGCSLEMQERYLRAYCDNHGYKIIGVYKDDYSAKHFDLRRPGMKALYEYCKKHRKEVDLVAFLRWDRFTRNLEFALTYKRKFIDELDIEINAIESPIDFKGTEWSMLLGMYCGAAHTEDEKISRRTKDGIHGTLLKGKCSNKAPRGYKNVRIAKHDCHVEIDSVKAPLITNVFKEVAKGVETASRIRRRMCPNIPESSFLEMLRNPFYMGKIRVPAYKDEPEQIVDGLHEGIVEAETFYKVQDILDGKRKKSPKLSKAINPDLFLRKFLVCPICGHALTGSESKGNGGKYAYYHCCHDGKHLRKRADEVNEAFAQYISCLAPNEAVMRLYEAILNDMRDEQNADNRKKAANLQAELEKVEARIQRARDLYLDGDMTKAERDEAIERNQKLVDGLKERIDVLTNPNRGNIKPKLNYSMSLINNMDQFIRDAPVAVKIKLISSIFPEKIEFDGFHYRTNSYNAVLDLIYKQTKELREPQKNNGESCDTFPASVPRAGVEPARVAPLVFETSASTDSAIWA